MPPQTLIVIPALNEEGRIGAVVRGIRALDHPLDVVVIDDGSTDGTAAEARRAGARVLTHPFTLGYGSALHTGYLLARRRGYQRVVQLDADGQHDPASIPELLAALDAGADVVVGSRYGRIDPPPPTTVLRRVGTAVFSRIVTWWTGVRITDPTSGYQAISARALEELAHDGFPEDYPDADVLILATRAGLSLVEIPVRMYGRAGGVSMHRGARAAYYGYKMLLSLLLLPVRRKTPFRARDTVAQTR